MQGQGGSDKEVQRRQGQEVLDSSNRVTFGDWMWQEPESRGSRKVGC